MAPREDLVSSAVTFLQDPTVASSPLQKRIEFLQSKNLTQEEIDLSLARSSDEPSQGPPPENQTYAPQQQVYRRQGYPPYGSYGDWQAPPPELPRRDWRDWFIMATVTGGAAYGLYVITKRYISPLIAPPTPPQLEADKTAIDEQFTRAFALIDSLSNDTATLKAAEEARTERLDRALEEVETVVTDLKAATKRREDETRRLNDEIRGIRDGIPKALESHKDSSDRRLVELSTELKSLKALMGNRFGGSQSTAQSQPQYTQRSGTSTPSAEPFPASKPTQTSENSSTTNSLPPFGSSSAPAYQFPQSSSTSTSIPSSRQGASSPFPSSTSGSGKAAIPAWQMAAANRKPVTPGTDTEQNASTVSGGSS